jgi:hypothetical protein
MLQTGQDSTRMEACHLCRQKRTNTSGITAGGAVANLFVRVWKTKVTDGSEIPVDPDGAQFARNDSAEALRLYRVRPGTYLRSARQPCKGPPRYALDLSPLLIRSDQERYVARQGLQLRRHSAHCLGVQRRGS